MPIVNADTITIVTTSQDAVRDLLTALTGITNTDQIRVVVVSDAQMRDAVARVIWPDKQKKGRTR